MDAEVELLASRVERASESDLAGKVRDELDEDVVSVDGRDEESLTFL